VFTARYKLNIIQVGAESETTFPGNIHTDCTRLGITTHKNLIKKSLYMVKDYTVLLMEPKSGTFIFQKLPHFLQNLKDHYHSHNNPPATLTASQKNLYSPFHYTGQKSSFTNCKRNN
jgi:hypothetical protein